MKCFRSPSAAASLFYHDLAGDGVPLIFLHGLGCASSCDYPMVATDPALRGRRAILLDLLGAGFSDGPLDFDYSVAAHARTVIELVDGLGADVVDLYGHSMGGAIAIETARGLGDRVRAVVVSEPNLDPGGGSFSRRIAEQPEEAYVRGGRTLLVEASRAAGNAVWAASLALSAPHAVHRAARSLVAGSSPSWREMLHGLAAATTVLFGEASLPDPDTDRLARRGIRVDVVPAAGHSMAWDNPSGLAAALRRATEVTPRSDRPGSQG